MRFFRRTYSVGLALLIALLAITNAYAGPPGGSDTVDQPTTIVAQDAMQDISDKIQSAMSAAPLAISRHATILDYPSAPGDPPAVLQEGDNGYICFPRHPDRPYPDPACLDEVWMAWVAARGAKEAPQNKTIGIGYMLQGGASASASDPFASPPADVDGWIKGAPHVMLLFPYKLDSADFPTTPDSGGAWIMFADTPYEHLMVPTNVELNHQAQDALQSALNAAPAAISQNATILNYPAEPGGPLPVLQEGDNGYTCFPRHGNRPYPDPACLDEVWMDWVIARGAKEAPHNRTIGIGYMLEGGASPSASDPFAAPPSEIAGWIHGAPHVMLLVPQEVDLAEFPTVPDSGGPWNMFADTPYEHLMIPTNVGLSDAQIEQALLPLPEPLKAGANIVGFDENWNQIMLRQGTDDMNCVSYAPFMAIQYAVCQHVSTQPFWVMGMKLRHEGMPQGEIDEDRINAMIDGSLETPVVGAARYFLIGGGPRVLFPLATISLPNATSESTGLSTEPSPFRPWLMAAGTPNAHVMIHGK